MNSNEVKDKLFTDPDFILIKRFNYSLKELLKKYPEGAPNKVIAQALNLSEDQLEVMIQNTLSKLKTLIEPNEI